MGVEGGRWRGTRGNRVVVRVCVAKQMEKTDMKVGVCGGGNVQWNRGSSFLVGPVLGGGRGW